MRAAAIHLALLASVAGVLVVLLIFAPGLQAPFLVPKRAALEISASVGLLGFVLCRASTGRPRWTGSVTAGALLVLATSGIAWMAAASRPGGAPYAVDALARWGSLFGIACGASVLADIPDARQRVLEGTVMGAAAVAAIGLLQHLEILPFAIPVISTPGSTFGNRNIAADVMAMALPLGAGAAFGRPPRARISIFCAMALILGFLGVTRARGAWIGGVCGLGTTIVLLRRGWLRPRNIAAVAAALVALGVAASMPGRFNARDVGDSKRYSSIGSVLKESFDTRSTALRTRLGLWRRTAQMVRDNPLFGVGPGNWPVEFPRYAEPDAARDGVLSATLAPRQAHDDLLERTAETGIFGLIGLGFLAVAVTLAVRHRLAAGDEQPTRTGPAAAAGALAAVTALSIVSFPLEMPGTLAMTGLALGFVAGIPPSGGPACPTRDVPIRIHALGVLALALFIVSAVRAERSIRSSRWLNVAEHAMSRDPAPIAGAHALAALNLALDARPDDPRVCLRASQVLL
ncbi:MAG: O-antigen ligase family protein, partial [Myxococcota bacterium]|nr:O-antigen ligase family protein [Myxococcota bacterium]